MKKRVILAVVTMLLATMLLSSCGDKIKPVKSYFDIFDKDMPFTSGASYNTKYTAIPELKKHIVFGVVTRNLIVPLLGIGAALLVGGFEGAHFATFVAVFCTPVAVSSVPMAQEMKADTALAGQLVVWTTVFSALSIFLASYVLKVMEIF